MRSILAIALLAVSCSLFSGCVSSVPVHGVKVPIKTVKKTVKTAAAVGAFIIPGGKKKKKETITPQTPTRPEDRPRYEPRRP